MEREDKSAFEKLKKEFESRGALVNVIAQGHIALLDGEFALGDLREIIAVMEAAISS